MQVLLYAIDMELVSLSLCSTFIIKKYQILKLKIVSISM
jgi:hypothetical protein